MFGIFGRRRRRRDIGFVNGRHPLAGTCRIVRMKGGRRRKLCWGRSGKIVSNKPA